MEPEITRQMRHLTELAEENNKILHSLQRTQRWSNFFSWIKWAIIIGITLWSYLVIQPYLDDVVKNYQGIKGLFGSSSTTTQNAPSFEGIRKLLSPDMK